VRRGVASGKVILFGEHAVVYGVSALAVGIDRGARAVATPAAASTLHVRGLGVRVTPEDDAPLGRAFRDLLDACGVTSPVDVEVETDLPAGAGLGCSAALGVGIARALDGAAAPDVVMDRVMAWERVFHGNPSGIDAWVAARGGCVVFRRREDGPPDIARVRVPRAIHLAIGKTGTPSSTRSMVEAVSRLRERRPDVVAKSFDAIATLVSNARLAVEAGDLRAVGQLLDLNQMLLAGLFVSTPEIESMCALARECGAFGAKLTGAGGGGCVVALVDGAASAEKVIAEWRAAGYDGFATRVAREEPRAVAVGESA
jgi:mevalonate kinase